MGQQSTPAQRVTQSNRANQPWWQLADHHCPEELWLETTLSALLISGNTGTPGTLPELLPTLISPGVPATIFSPWKELVSQ